jgi:hypothetical protein
MKHISMLLILLLLLLGQISRYLLLLGLCLVLDR